MTLDPVTLAVIQNGLRQVASEMDLVHEKTSFSPVISEGFDRSNGIYDRTTGETLYGRVPAGSVVVAGSLPTGTAGCQLYCAVIVKQVDAKTRSKTSINELLRA